jgi:hypothetical protein
MASAFPLQAGNPIIKPSVLLIRRSATIISNGIIESVPRVTISAPQKHVPERTLTSSKRGSNAPIRVSSLALNQVPSLDASISLAVFYSTPTKFHHLSIFYVASDLKSSLETSVTTPRTPRSSIQYSAYHSNILVALSETFQVDIYHLPTTSSDTKKNDVKASEAVSTEKPILICTLSSFSSFPPASLRISRPTTSAPHKVLLSYAVPIYPAHWSVATTEFLINPPSPTTAVDITSTRTLRVFHGGWTIENEEELNINSSVSLPQNCTKLPAIAALQTDGRHLVVVPRNETFMLLYRMRQTSLSFVRVLSGPVEPVLAIAVADARCVGVCKDAAVWVWDLEGTAGVGIEVEEPIEASEQVTGGYEDMQVCFDDRRIVVVTPTGLRTISFD